MRAYPAGHYIHKTQLLTTDLHQQQALIFTVSAWFLPSLQKTMTGSV